MAHGRRGHLVYTPQLLSTYSGVSRDPKDLTQFLPQIRTAGSTPRHRRHWLRVTHCGACWALRESAWSTT